jgi:hypothetical protein
MLMRPTATGDNKMPDIYGQHRAAFAKVVSYVILDGYGDRVATVAIKFPRDGASRLYAYVHVFGYQMVRGWAGGGGYDKRSAAVSSAIRSIKPADDLATKSAEWTVARLRAACALMDSSGWERELERAGFRVLQAV